MRDSDLSIVEYRGSEAFERLAIDWRRLYYAMRRRSSPHSLESHHAYFDLFMTNPEAFRCLAVTDASGVLAICPLEARMDRLLGIPVRVWGIPIPPHEPVADIICPDDSLRERLIPLVAHHLRNQPEGRRLLVIGPLSEDSALWSGLAQLKPAGYCLNRLWKSNVFDTTSSMDELSARFSKNFRAKLRKADSKLHALGEVEYVTAMSDDDLRTEYAKFLEIEASGWKGEHGTRTAVRFREQQPAFFGRLATALEHGDRCEINGLYLDGRCIATQYCMRTGEDYAILKSGYDESYAQVSPGQLLRRHTLERCCNDPEIKRCSLLSDYDWQNIWHPDSIAVQQAHVAIGAVSGRFLMSLYHFRIGRARQIARRLKAASHRETRSPHA